MAKAASNLVFSAFAVFLLLASTASLAEDIELYLSETAQQAERRPKVLIIFDTSGSMKLTDTAFKAEYDPAGDYGTPASEQNYLYYSFGGTELPIPGESNQKFLASINGCNVSHEALGTIGNFTGKIRRYRQSIKTWKNLKKDKGHLIEVLDCKEDVAALNPNNAQHKEGAVLPDGYPVNDQGSDASHVYYTD